MFRSIANRNDANVVATLSVSARHDLIFKQSKRQDAPLTIGFPIVLRREGEAAKDLGCVSEINSMCSQVRLSLGLNPPQEAEL